MRLRSLKAFFGHWLDKELALFFLVEEVLKYAIARAYFRTSPYGRAATLLQISFLQLFPCPLLETHLKPKHLVFFCHVPDLQHQWLKLPNILTHGPSLPLMLFPPSIPFIALLLRPAPALMLMVIPRPQNPGVCSCIYATGESFYGSGNGYRDPLRRKDLLPFPVLSSGKRWGLAQQCLGWSDGICLIPIACCLFNLYSTAWRGPMADC